MTLILIIAAVIAFFLGIIVGALLIVSVDECVLNTPDSEDYYQPYD